MTRLRSAFIWLLTSLLLASVWFVLQAGTHGAVAQDQADKTDKPAATSEADTTTPAKSTTDSPAADEDTGKAKRDEAYHAKLEAERQHTVKELSDEFRQLEKEEERFQTYAFVGAGAIGILLVGLFVFSRVRKK